MQSPAALRLLNTMVWSFYSRSLHRQSIGVVCSNLTLAMDGPSAPISVLDTDLYKVRVVLLVYLARVLSRSIVHDAASCPYAVPGQTSEI